MGAAASDVAQDRGPVARRGDHESGIASGRYRDRRQKGQAATADPPQRSTYLVLMPDLGGHQRSFVNVNGRLPFKVCHSGANTKHTIRPIRCKYSSETRQNLKDPLYDVGQWHRPQRID